MLVVRTGKFWGLFTPGRLHQQVELKRKMDESGCNEKLSWFRGTVSMGSSRIGVCPALCLSGVHSGQRGSEWCWCGRARHLLAPVCGEIERRAECCSVGDSNPALIFGAPRCPPLPAPLLVLFTGQLWEGW